MQANEDVIEDLFRVDAHEYGLVVPAIEYGTLSRSASLLMQSGFSSRKAALNAVSSTNAAFSNGTQFREWLHSDITSELSSQSDWPTPETSTQWHNFVGEYESSSNSIWGVTSKRLPVAWLTEYEPVSGSTVKILNHEEGVTAVLGSDGEKVGFLMARYQLLATGIYYAVIADDTDYLAVDFYGSGENPFEESIS